MAVAMKIMTPCSLVDSEERAASIFSVRVSHAGKNGQRRREGTRTSRSIREPTGAA
jgi:hypothetical protein